MEQTLDLALLPRPRNLRPRFLHDPEVNTLSEQKIDMGICEVIQNKYKKESKRDARRVDEFVGRSWRDKGWLRQRVTGEE